MYPLDVFYSLHRFKDRDNYFAIPVKKIKVKIKYNKQLIALTIKDSSSNYRALSIYTTLSSAQSRETVLLNKYFIDNFKE